MPAPLQNPELLHSNEAVTPPPSARSVTPGQTEAETTHLQQDQVGGICETSEFNPRPNSNDSPCRHRIASIYHKYNPQLVFENRGSTARDHLASERTFLAYVRTSLALASAGVALVQLFTMADLTSRTNRNVPYTEAVRNFQRFARPLGVSTVLMGLILLLIAVYRYFLIQNSLPKNMFPVARLSVAFTTFALTAVTVVIFGALLGGRS